MMIFQFLRNKFGCRLHDEENIVGSETPAVETNWSGCCSDFYPLDGNPTWPKIIMVIMIITARV